MYYLNYLDYLICNSLSFLYIWNIGLLSNINVVKFFPHSVGFRFVFLTVYFSLQTFFSFTRSHLLIVNLSASTISVIFRKLSPVPLHSRLSHTLSSIMFSVSGFMLRSLVYLYLRLVQNDVCGSLCVLLDADIQIDQHLLLQTVSFFLYVFTVSL